MPTLERDNAKIHYELEGSGPTVIYICGFSDHSNSISSSGIRHTLSEKYRVICLDNRGAGQTVVNGAESTSIDDMADDVAAVMDAEGVETAPILGISMGGAIALTLALRHPDKVEKLVVAVSNLGVEVPSRSAFILETRQSMIESGLPQETINRYSATVLLGEDVFKYEEFIEAWVNAPVDPLQQTPQGFQLQKRAAEKYDIREHAAAITVPTLVFSSPDDLLVPPRYQEEIAALLPHAELKHYPGGHAFMVLPMYRDAFFTDVFAFWEQNSTH